MKAERLRLVNTDTNDSVVLDRVTACAVSGFLRALCEEDLEEEDDVEEYTIPVPHNAWQLDLLQELHRLALVNSEPSWLPTWEKLSSGLSEAEWLDLKHMSRQDSGLFGGYRAAMQRFVPEMPSEYLRHRAAMEVALFYDVQLMSRVINVEVVSSLYVLADP